MAGTTSPEERIERLKALLTGSSDSTRGSRAPGSEGLGNLMLGVALHGADRQGAGRQLSDLEELLVPALEAVLEKDEKEVAAWGAAYRETVTGAAPGTLIVPRLIAEWPAESGFAVADLQEVMADLKREVAAQPNLSLLSLEDLAAGREESPAFVEAMRESGFAVTGVAQYPGTSGATEAAEAGEAGEADAAPLASWRARLEMDSFYVERAVGDQGGGRDEIYFTASSSAGGGKSRTFRSQEFGAVKQDQTRNFSKDNCLLLDDEVSEANTVITSIQVWEADQSSSRWYDNLQSALNLAVEKLDSVLSVPGASDIVSPLPNSVTIAYEISKFFISLMDALRNQDDLSCSRTLVLSRNQMAIMFHRKTTEWSFNGDGWHQLRVRYTGGRPVYPTGSIELVFREQTTEGDNFNPFSVPVPLGFKTATAPRLATFRGKRYLVFSRVADKRLQWSRYEDGAWTKPKTVETLPYSNQPVALAVYRNELHCLFTGMYGTLCHSWFDGNTWSKPILLSDWKSALAPSMTIHLNGLWSTHTGLDNQIHLARYVNGTWQNHDIVAATQSSPSVGSTGGNLFVTCRGDALTLRTYKRQSLTWKFDALVHGGDDTATLFSDNGTVWMATTAGIIKYRASTDNGSKWMDGGTKIPDAKFLGAPGAVVHDGHMYIAYHRA
ncbi:hypothetical protein [Streptomyces sp. NPDC101206]|uniref:hypothetical protein n=1 Tax=Streptomyces sp. NPDC101206 TaxID=3366128 RepID=UPI0038281AFD